ncbi:MAG TPA: outer membrane lipoprotein-sorting protein [Myxococcota bacterium]|nr:outer membrane lipoprotein-sorting protein [Myxococcota bacterium]HRY93894.1 outer membrane lipoprotein-sorting protein [Myxococcota bacterium]
MVRVGGMALVAALWLLSGPALALSGDEVLAKVDQAEFSAKDSTATVRMELEDADGAKSYRKMEMYQQGTSKRLIRFLEPADVKGMAFLDEGTDGGMYLWLPALQKVRLVAGHVKNDNFAGTDFSYEDLSSDTFASRLTVQGMTEDAEHHVLALQPKPDKDSDYGPVKLFVRKADFLFDRIEFSDKSGKPWKVMTRSDFRPAGKYTQSYLMEIKDVKKNHATRNFVEKLQVDTGLKDSFFSKRQLKRN